MTESVPTKPRTRVNWSAAEKTEWLRLFAKSGQSAAEFCRNNDLSPNTFSLWRQQQAAETESETAALIEVPAETVRAAIPAASVAPAISAQVTVSLPCGIRLEVPAGVDIAWLGSLLRSVIDARR
jgi:transposase-like protein